MPSEGSQDDKDSQTVYLTKLLLTRPREGGDQTIITSENIQHDIPNSEENGDDEDAAEIKDYLYVRTKWLKDSLRVAVQEAKTAKSYCGIVKNEELTTIAEELGIPYPAFIEECRSALTAHIAKPKFTVTLDDAATLPSSQQQQRGDDTHYDIVFRLKKMADFEMYYLEVPMQEMKNKCSLLDTAVGQLQTAAREYTLTQTIKTATSARIGNGDINELKSLVEAKEENERRLMKRFILLLQQKKDRIAELEQRLATTRQDRSRSQTPPSQIAEQMDENSDDDFERPTQAFATKS